jgi:hypothetical protein
MPSKEVERAVFDLCREAVPGFPDGQVQDHESPDFLVGSGDRTIGVEMQEFIQGAGKDGAPARQAEGVRDAIMGKAQAQFEARNPGSYPHVYPYWVRPVSGQIRTPRDLPARICALVESVVREPAQEGDVMTKRDASYPDLEAAGLEGWLTHLTVYLYAPATYGLWSSSEWGYVSQDLLALADQVHAKDMKLPAYHAACDEIWLVLYARASPSGSFDMDVLEGKRLLSVFDHVVFLDVVSKRYVMLAG